MRGTLQDCFDISSRAVIAVLTRVEGDLKVGDWLVIGSARWRVHGVETRNYLGGTPPLEESRDDVGVLLRGASKADLLPLIGVSYHTEGASIEAPP